MEHIDVIHEVINDAKDGHKTVHISCYDLADASGSVSPGRIVTKDRVSESFRLKRDVFQGCSYSDIIFLIIFNPLMTFIQSLKRSHGYEMGRKETKIISKPFADDFQIITRHKSKHQRLQNLIQEIKPFPWVLYLGLKVQIPFNMRRKTDKL